jgi:hypothetical protein
MSGSQTSVLSTPPTPAPAALPAPEPDHLPHDIREIIPYVWSWEDWRTWGMILTAVLLLTALIYWLWKRRKAAPLPPPEDPILVANRFLQQLVPPQPFVGKAQAEYFYQLNLGLRHYVELTCGFSATEMTLRELREKLQTLSQFSTERKQDLNRFFERTDLIKFAKAETSLQEALESHEKILGWLKWWNQTIQTAETES